MSRRLARSGAVTVGVGMAIDVPPHLAPHASMEGMALAGHVVVLVGMVIVLVGLCLAALSLPPSETRRLS